MSIRSRLNDILSDLTPPVISTMLNKLLYSRQILSAKKKMEPYSKFHLACGPNIFDGWANIDLLGGAKVIRWNCTTRFPLKSGTIKFIYIEHFIEHITQIQGEECLKECYRVLQAGGVLRISTPNLRQIVDEYLLGESSQWRNLTYSSNTGSSYTPCRMVNDAMRLWGHQFVYDGVELRALLEKIGFKVTPASWRDSKYEELNGLESRPFYGDIILEAVK